MKAAKAIASLAAAAMLVLPAVSQAGKRAPDAAVIVGGATAGAAATAPLVAGSGNRKTKRVDDEFQLVGQGLLMGFASALASGSLGIGNGSNQRFRSRGAN